MSPLIRASLFVISLTLAVGCGTADDGSADFDEVEVSQEIEAEPLDQLDDPSLLVTCPVTLSCYGSPPAGSGWYLASTDFCGSLIKCNWSRFSPPGYTITYLNVPSQCPVCRKSSGSTNACGTPDSPGTWTCSAQ
jgi:hypothetical protein